MKLGNVSRILMVRIEYDELHNYLTALDKVITDNNEQTTEIATLKQFSIELTKLLHSAMDW